MVGGVGQDQPRTVMQIVERPFLRQHGCASVMAVKKVFNVSVRADVCINLGLLVRPDK